MKRDFLLVGVGGQGTILASDIVAEVGLLAGYDAKKSEIHGMSQRGGSVDSHVRWGARVYSPLAAKGGVDYLVAFELLEAARWAPHLAPGGVAIVNRHRIPPLAVTRAEARYPTEEEVLARFAALDCQALVIEGTQLATELGNPAAAGIVLIGVLSTLLDVDAGDWLAVIARRVPPRFLYLNRRAFNAGREHVGVMSRESP